MNGLRRLLPHPVLSLLLVVCWLWLNNTLEPGHVLLGAALGVAIPYVTRRFWPEPLVVRRHPHERGRFQIIHGHHRFEALRTLGRAKAQAIVWNVDDEQTDPAQLGQLGRESPGVLGGLEAGDPIHRGGERDAGSRR